MTVVTYAYMHSIPKRWTRIEVYEYADLGNLYQFYNWLSDCVWIVPGTLED